MSDDEEAAREQSYEHLTPYELAVITSPDKELTEVLRSEARRLVGGHRVHEIEQPSMGAEDFSHYLGFAPGAMLRLGVGHDGPGGRAQYKFSAMLAATAPQVQTIRCRGPGASWAAMLVSLRGMQAREGAEYLRTMG